MRIAHALAAVGLAAGCTVASIQPSAAASGPAQREVIRGGDGEPYAFTPLPGRDLGDLVRGCLGMNPERRPRGSNCHGIFPEQCGADLARAHLGEVLTSELRARISNYSPTGDVRFIRPGEAVIQDLRYGRLNIGLDAGNRMEDADCY